MKRKNKYEMCSEHTKEPAVLMCLNEHCECKTHFCRMCWNLKHDKCTTKHLVDLRNIKNKITFSNPDQSDESFDDSIVDRWEENESQILRIHNYMNLLIMLFTKPNPKKLKNPDALELIKNNYDTFFEGNTIKLRSKVDNLSYEQKMKLFLGVEEEIASVLKNTLNNLKEVGRSLVKEENISSENQGIDISNLDERKPILVDSEKGKSQIFEPNGFSRSCSMIMKPGKILKEDIQNPSSLEIDRLKIFSIKEEDEDNISTSPDLTNRFGYSLVSDDPSYIDESSMLENPILLSKELTSKENDQEEAENKEIQNQEKKVEKYHFECVIEAKNYEEAERLLLKRLQNTINKNTKTKNKIDEDKVVCYNDIENDTQMKDAPIKSAFNAEKPHFDESKYCTNDTYLSKKKKDEKDPLSDWDFPFEIDPISKGNNILFQFRDGITADKRVSILYNIPLTRHSLFKIIFKPIDEIHKYPGISICNWFPVCSADKEPYFCVTYDIDFRYNMEMKLLGSSINDLFGLGGFSVGEEYFVEYWPDNQVEIYNKERTLNLKESFKDKKGPFYLGFHQIHGKTAFMVEKLF